MLEQFSSACVLSDQVEIMMVFEYLIKLYDVRMSCFPQYFQLLAKSVLIGLTFNIPLIDHFDSNLLLSMHMPGNFNFIESTLPNSFSKDILTYFSELSRLAKRR